MMDPATIQCLWRYMVHADQQMVDAIATVSPEGYRREQNISMGSISKLVNHCISAHRTWIRRLRGEDITYIDYPPLDQPELAQGWGEVHADLLAFADEQTPESLAQMIRSHNRMGKYFELPTWSVMLHVSDHATYHRGQLNSMIKLAGGKPSSVMMYTYTVEMGIGRDITDLK